MKQNIDNMHKDLSYKHNLSHSIILDSNIRNSLSDKEKTDLIIKQLILLKDNEEVKSNEYKNKQSIDKLMSSITTGEEVFSYLVDNISQINTNLKHQFENSHRNSATEELILLRDEYKKHNFGRRLMNTHKGVKFESTYVPLSCEDKSLILENNSKRSTERKDVYNYIFEFLREDIDIIIKHMGSSLNPTSINSPCESFGFSDGIKAVDKDEINADHLQRGEVNINAKRSVSNKKKAYRKKSRIFSWNKMDWERNNINMKKDVNHFIELKEEPIESEYHSDTETTNKHGYLLKSIYDLCCKFNLDDNTLNNLIIGIKNEEHTKTLIKKEKLRHKHAEFKPEFRTDKRAEQILQNVVIHAEKLIDKPRDKSRKSTPVGHKIETKSLRLKQYGLNLNNISNLSYLSISKKAAIKPFEANELKLPLGKHFCFSPQGQTTKNDTFFNSHIS
jgi:hypothetical protein